MHLGESLKIGITEIRLHKMRSFLTMLGVIFGVAAVIATSAIGAGAAEELDRQLAMLGANTVRIRAAEVRGAEASAAIRRSPFGLTLRDVEAIRTIAPQIAHAAALKKSEARAFAGSRALAGEVWGAGADLAKILGYRVEEGRFLTPQDVVEAKQVCVIGAGVRRAAFPLEDPIGQRLMISGQAFQVVGVLAARGEGGGETVIEVGNVDRDIYVPVTSAYRRLAVERDPRADRLDEIILQVGSGEDLREASTLVGRILERRHRGVPDYQIIVPEELIRQQQETAAILGNVLIFVAAISLLVGGIGIMNILLATVTQRTREIGIRRALGAMRRDILGQFLVESLAISLLGGVAGIGLGYGLALLISEYAGWLTIVQASAIMLSTGVSAAVGLLFGLYPAMKAAQLDPIEALRSE